MLNHNILKKISDKGLSEAIQNELDQIYAYYIIYDREPARNYTDKNLKFVKTCNLKELYLSIFFDNMDILLHQFLFVYRRDPIIAQYIDSSLDDDKLHNGICSGSYRGRDDFCFFYQKKDNYEQFTSNLSMLEDKICEYIRKCDSKSNEGRKINDIYLDYEITIEKMIPKKLNK